MSRYYFNEPSDLLNKAKRDFERIQESYGRISDCPERLADDVFNFFITAFSIKDWIKNSNKELSNDVENYVKKDENLSICREICNASKHFELRKNDNVETIKKIGTKYNGSYNHDSTINYTGKDIVCILLDGSSYSLNNLCKSIIASWNSFFILHKIR